MNKKQLFERVLGAILVSALGFILYSAFLDSSGRAYVDRSTQIPVPSRYIEPLAIEDSAIVNIPARDAEQLFIPRQEVSQEEALQAPVTEKGLPNAWVIQVGSFSSEDKAGEIRDRLIAESYKAYYRKLTASDPAGQSLYRVLIGPYVNAEEAVRHQRQVDKMLELSSLLMKFEP